MKNLVLIGLPGCGKSTVGKCLATELALEFVDCDVEIEKLSGKSIAELFAQDGEEVFRNWESDVLASALNTPGKVISTGGGVVGRAVNREAMRRAAVVFLDRKPENIMLTCDMAGRPMMTRYSLEDLSAQRRQLYLDCADHVVTAENLEIITSDIIGYWREGICAF